LPQLNGTFKRNPSGNWEITCPICEEYFVVSDYGIDIVSPAFFIVICPACKYYLKLIPDRV